jgi:hypothetical protein
VPLIDPRTGLIDRAWYMFFLSLLNAATTIDNGDVGIDAISLIASYDAALQALAQEVETQPPPVDLSAELIKQIEAAGLIDCCSGLLSQIAEIQKQIDALNASPNLRPPSVADVSGLGTMAVQNADNVAITGGTINNTTIGATTPSTGVFTTLTATGQTSLGGVAGAEGLRVTSNPSATSWVEISGSAGGIPNIKAEATGASAELRLSSKSGSNVSIWTNNVAQRQLQVSHTASAVNYVQVTGAATTGLPQISAQGSDTNPGLLYITKGIGEHRFASNASAANIQFRIAHTASAVNYVQVTGAATGNNTTISAQGSDSAIGVNFQSKGTSGFNFFSGAGSNRQLRIDGTITSVNYLDIWGGASGASPSLRVAGSDTNIDLTLTPKGTGNVRFGTYTGTALSIAGFIEIKDSGGTVRKLAVVA